MKVLYAGDSPPGGSANYLLGILRSLRATVRHVPPEHTLSRRVARAAYDAIILSDFPRRGMSAAAEEALAEQADRGAGLLMVGGWASFAGPNGGWRGSPIERRLPVTCRSSDDRISFQSGAIVCAVDHHPMFRGLSFRDAPVICGLNDLAPRRGSRVVLTARRILRAGRARLRLADRAHPLLVLGTGAQRRIAALATDLAPHWCGGLVDWGARRVTLPVAGAVRVEVGDRYVRFVSQLLRWLADGD